MKNRLGKCILLNVIAKESKANRESELSEQRETNLSLTRLSKCQILQNKIRRR